MTTPATKGAAENRTCVIALGNPDRGDDGAAQAVIDRLAQHSLAADLISCQGDSMTLLNFWQDYARVIVIDVLAPGSTPGTVRHHTVSDRLFDDLPQAPSSHLASLPEAWRLAKALDRLPECLLLITIEGASFSIGTPLSPSVAQAVPKAADEVTRLVSQFTGKEKVDA